MTLLETLNNDIKTAMKAKDRDRLDVLRMLKTSVQMAEIDKKKPLDQAEELTILSRELKQRKESRKEFHDAGRDELVAHVDHEIEIVETYLPKQLSTEEVLTEVKAIADKIGAKSKADFGKLMGASVKALKGEADGNMIKEAATKVLNQ